MNVGDKELDKSPDEAFILKAVSLRRSFFIGEAEVSVLKGLSLDIKRYEKLFLRGASGAVGPGVRTTGQLRQHRAAWSRDRLDVRHDLSMQC